MFYFCVEKKFGHLFETKKRIVLRTGIRPHFFNVFFYAKSSHY